MQSVGAMEDQSGDGEWHPSGSSQKRTKKKENPRIGYCIIYGRSFSVAPSLITGRRQSQGASVSGVTGCLVWERRPLACLRPRFHL